MKGKHDRPPERSPYTGAVIVLITLVFLGAAVIPELSAQPRTVSFADYEWAVRSSDTPSAPGNNTFSDSREDLWVDDAGHLNMTLGEHATEIRARRSLGYGVYEARLFSRLDRLDPQAVLGFFIFELPSEHPYHREIDIEFSRWGNPRMTNMQFSVQPSSDTENRHRFNIEQEGLATTHRFEWLPGSIRFVSWHGHGEYPPPERLVASRFSVEGPLVPEPRRERIYFNFWRYQGNELQDTDRERVVITDFRFSPPD